MSTNPSRGSRLNRGDQRRGPGLVHHDAVGAPSSDRRSRSKFEHIPSISRSSGVEPDGDTYVHIFPCIEVPGF
jgi:hypothetical protein